MLNVPYLRFYPKCAPCLLMPMVSDGDLERCLSIRILHIFNMCTLNGCLLSKHGFSMIVYVTRNIEANVRRRDRLFQIY